MASGDSTAAYTLIKLTEPLQLGEGPHWDDRAQALYFVDIAGNSIHKYHPDTKKHMKTEIGGSPGFIIPVEGTTDQFVVGLDKKFVIIRWDGQDGSPVDVEEITREVTTTSKINDGKCDPRGRLFAGTLGEETSPGKFTVASGSLFRLDGKNPVKIADKLFISNGLAWDVKRKAFYYIDSMEKNIRRYEYDVETGNISNMKHIFDFERNNVDGKPDGATIDTDGNIWVACFEGSSVIKINPVTGKLLKKIIIPAKQVTSVTFGGRNLDTLFVTTACLNLGEEQKPPSGSTFMISNLEGAKGLPNVSFKL